MSLSSLLTCWAHHGNWLASPSSGSTICIAERAVPSFYLLGQQKAGTSTMAQDLFFVGLRSAQGWDKELHTFDDHCNFTQAISRSAEEWAGHSGVCEPLNKIQTQAWADNFEHDCSWDSGDLTDMTPENLRLPSLPGVLQNLYAASSAQLRFVVAIRNPLSRLHSGYYQFQIPLVDSFAEYVDMLRTRVPPYEAVGWAGIETDYLLDQFYRSMYSLNLEPWLETFNPRQFVVVPMKPYYESLDIRRKLLDEIGNHFSIEFHTERIREATQVYAKEHPTLEEDLPPEDIAWINRAYFDPDARRLASVLAQRLPEGLAVAGFAIGVAKTTDEVEDYVTRNW